MQFFKRPFLTLGAAILALTIAAPIQAQPAPAAKKEVAKAPAAQVDINNATAAELEAVKGIGAATSKKIIAGRPYTAVADLAKAGLSKSQITSLTPMLKVGPAPAVAKAAPATTPTPAAKTAPAAASKGGPTPTLPLAPGGGAGKVWVNKDSKVFHREGDRWYGRTKEGAYMTEAEALKGGYHETKEKEKKKK